MRQLWDWLEDRVGYRSFVERLRNRTLPHGPSWWFTSASCLFWLFVVQLVTGLLLMTTYSPSTSSAWASVHYIEQAPAGAFIRGVHYFAAHALIIAFGVHVLRVLFAGAFRAPRELVWITGLLLIPLVLVLAVSGNPLSASQKGMSQIEVEANIAGSSPLIGSALRYLLLGGDETGNLTLTHLYFLHVGLVPLAALVLLAIHLAQVYRHGLTPLGPIDASRAVSYWPYQTVRNLIVLTAVLGSVAVLAWRWGAPLDAPADPDLVYMPRPEWYFRFLFELRRYFTGEWEFVATLVLPLAGLLFFVAVPFFDWLLPRKVSFVARTAIVVAALGGWGWLTWASFDRDWRDKEYMASEAEAARLAARARLLADQQQIPPEGAATLLRSDPKTRGPQLFARHCASCHPHAGPAQTQFVAADSSAPNLHGFGTADWLQRLLDPQVLKSSAFFGRTKFAEGDMVSHMEGLWADTTDAMQLRNQLQLAALALAAEAELDASTSALPAPAHVLAEGRKLIAGDLGCTDCHRFHDHGELGSAPDLTGYGSRQWLTEMISNPQRERFYADDRNDRMPAFAKDAHDPKQNLLNPQELDLLVRWLRGEWYEPNSPPSDNRSPSQQLAERESPAQAAISPE